MSLVQNRDSKKAKLTSRQKTIIEILTKYTPSNPTTILAISQKLKLSSRTISRELSKIEKWLFENNFNFIKKPKVGLIIDETIENQKLILELLEVENIKRIYSKDERRKLILIELLSNSEPIKSLYFKSKFKISDGTFSNDICYISNWLKNYNISTIRKQGVGIYIDGDENDYRQAIVNVLYDFIGEYDILSILNNNFNNTNIYQNRIFNFIDNKTMKKVEEILIYTKKNLHIKYTDSAYIGLIVHISLAIKRIQNFEKIEMDSEKLSKLKITPEFSVAEEIAKLINKNLNVFINDDEIGYITIHLLSAKIWINNKNIPFDANNIKEIVINMINCVESELDIYLSDNDVLIQDLCNHIAPVLTRLYMNVNIKNSQLKIIKEKYTDIYDATKKACNILKDITKIDEVPENEIAFISMHFCVAFEKIKSIENKISAVVVCPTGIGSSKMLAINILKYFDNINIKYVMSAINIDIKKLYDENIDIIISTIKLDIDFLNICVNPIFFEQDKILLKNAIKNITKRNDFRIKKNKKQNINKSDVLYIQNFSKQILNVISSFELLIIKSLKDRYELLKSASSIFAYTVNDRDIIYKSMLERENISETFISDFKIMLLHCKTDVVKNCCFGYIRIEQPIEYNDNEIIGATVMIVPDTNDIINTQIMSEISGAIVENNKFLESLNKKTKYDILIDIEKILMKYYRKTILKRLEC